MNASASHGEAKPDHVSVLGIADVRARGASTLLRMTPRRDRHQQHGRGRSAGCQSPKYATRRAVAAGALVVIVAGLLVGGALGTGPAYRVSHGSTIPAARHPSPADRTHAATGRKSSSATPHGPSASGPFAVGLRYLRVVEPATERVANASTDTGRPARVLSTAIRYPASGPAGGGERLDAPAAAGPFPLIVFSQGYDTPVAAYAGLLDAWARVGYVVAAPTYPHTNPNAGGGLDENDIVNHPDDLRAVISRLTAEARKHGGALTGLADPRRLAVVGQSDGGDVSLAVAANSCCREPAVKAAAILSGAELSGFGGSYYRDGSPPLLVIQGNRDTINPPGCSAALYDQAPVPKYYLDLLGASHLPPYVKPGQLRDSIAGTVIAFLDYYLRERDAPLQRLRWSGGVPGVATLTTARHLAGRSTYCPS